VRSASSVTPEGDPPQASRRDPVVKASLCSVHAAVCVAWEGDGAEPQRAATCNAGNLPRTETVSPLASSVRSKPFLNAVSDILRFTKRIGGSSVLLHSTGLGIHRDMRYRIAAPCGAGLPLLRVTTAAPADSSEEPRGCATGHSVGFHNLGVGMAVPGHFRRSWGNLGSVETTLLPAKCLPTSKSTGGTA